MMISLSDKALALGELQKELQSIEIMQLKVGEDIAKLFMDQVRLADRSRALVMSMEKIMQHGI